MKIKIQQLNDDGEFLNRIEQLTFLIYNEATNKTTEFCTGLIISDDYTIHTLDYFTYTGELNAQRTNSLL